MQCVIIIAHGGGGGMRARLEACQYICLIWLIFACCCAARLAVAQRAHTV